jgi:uncharacterized protein (UPF0332 family)
MDARQFLRLAEALIHDLSGRVLLTPTLDAAACRSATSRAYYAAFHVAHEFLDRINVVVGQNPQTHVTVQHALNNSGDATLALVNSQLRTLFTDRLAADYDLAKPAPEQRALAAVTLALATDVIDQLDRLAAGSAGVPFDPVAAAAAILNWAAVTGKTNVKRK